MDYQQILFSHIKEIIDKNTSLVHEVSEILNISNDSSYRRLRGETELTFNEIQLIAQHFNISIDSILNSNNNTVNFHYQEINEKDFSFVHYLEKILSNIQQIEKQADKEIIFVANNIPFFHTFQIPEISAFKAFVWQKTVLNNENMQKKKFKFEVPDEKLKEVSRQLRNIYTRIPSTEIFHPGTIDVTLNQIEYYSIAGLFENWKDAILLCDKMTELVNHLENQAMNSSKFHPKQRLPKIIRPNYTLYFNDVLYIDDTILVKAGSSRSVYLINMTLNSLVTNSNKFYTDFNKSVKNLMSKSTLISGTSEKERSRVFMNYRKKIDLLKNKLMNY